MGSVRCWEGSTTTNTPSGEPPLPAPCLIRLHSPLENGPFPNSVCPYRRWQTTRFHDGSHFGMRPLEQRRPANKGPPPVPPATLRSPQPPWLKRQTRLGRRGKKGGSHPRLKHRLKPFKPFPKKGHLKKCESELRLGLLLQLRDAESLQLPESFSDLLLRDRDGCQTWGRG